MSQITEVDDVLDVLQSSPCFLLEILSDEIVLHILSFVPAPDDLYEVAFVSHNLRRLSCDNALKLVFHLISSPPTEVRLFNLTIILSIFL